jgi:Fur family zinc uptake transcriptional regulator
LRGRVADIVSGRTAPLGAYAIMKELSRREGKRIAPPTARAPDFFLEHGFVHKIESLNAYTPCEHLGHAHHGMLMICETCGRSGEVDDDDVMRAIHRRRRGVHVAARDGGGEGPVRTLRGGEIKFTDIPIEAVFPSR